MAADRRDRLRRATAGLVAAVSVVVAGCSDSGGGTDSSGTPNSVGADLYQQTCASCHGADLRGTDQGPSHLSQVYEPGHHPDRSFRAAIIGGSPAHHWDFGDMPPVPGLDDDEIDAIIAYIREQQAIHGFE